MGMEETLTPGPNFNRPVKGLVYKDLLTNNVECHMDPKVGKATIGKERTEAVLCVLTSDSMRMLSRHYCFKYVL